MAIAFVGAGPNGDGTGPLSGSLVCTRAFVAGQTGIAAFTSGGVTPPTVTGISGGGTWSRLVTVTNGTIKTEIWATAVGGATSAASITFTYSGTNDFVIGIAAPYTGVLAIGTTNTATATGANPSISLTTQDANNFVVSAIGTRFGNDATAGTGNLRSTWGQASTGGAGGQGDLALVDNTSAGVASVTTSVTQSSAIWASAAVELRTVSGLLAPAPLLGSLFVGPYGFAC